MHQEYEPPFIMGDGNFEKMKKFWIGIGHASNKGHCSMKSGCYFYGE